MSTLSADDQLLHQQQTEKLDGNHIAISAAASSSNEEQIEELLAETSIEELLAEIEENEEPVLTCRPRLQSARADTCKRFVTRLAFYRPDTPYSFHRGC